MSKSNKPPRKQLHPQFGRQAATNPSDNHPVSVSFQQVQVEGPLPPPEILQHYNTLVPGAAERIIRMAEAEMEHRHGLERKKLDSDVAVREIFQRTEAARIRALFQSDRWGQILGAFVSLASIAGAGITAGLNAPWQTSVAFLGLPVLGMVKAITSSHRKLPQPADQQTSKH